MGVFYQEPSLLVGLSKPVANRRLVWRCELRLCLGLSFLFFDTLTLAHIRGLEPERTTAQKPILMPEDKTLVKRVNRVLKML